MVEAAASVAEAGDVHDAVVALVLADDLVDGVGGEGVGELEFGGGEALGTDITLVDGEEVDQDNHAHGEGACGRGELAAGGKHNGPQAEQQHNQAAQGVGADQVEAYGGDVVDGGLKGAEVVGILGGHLVAHAVQGLHLLGADGVAENLRSHPAQEGDEDADAERDVNLDAVTLPSAVLAEQLLQGQRARQRHAQGRDDQGCLGGAELVIQREVVDHEVRQGLEVVAHGQTDG